jgi:hypothetical protein
MMSIGKRHVLVCGAGLVASIAVVRARAQSKRALFFSNSEHPYEVSLPKVNDVAPNVAKRLLYPSFNGPG